MTAVRARPVTVKAKIGDLDLPVNLNLRRISIFVDFLGFGFFFRSNGEEDEEAIYFLTTCKSGRIGSIDKVMGQDPVTLIHVILMGQDRVTLIHVILME